MSNEFMRQEVNEAIAAGEQALASLYMAQERLNNARSWGIFDMLGGGFFTGMIKHSNMREASAYMEDAKRALQVFERELRDVSVVGDLSIEIGGFLTFADFFFDGFVADYLVQSKIADAREQVSEAIRRTESLMRELRQQV